MTDMLREFDGLAETIRARAVGKKIVFIPNPGNYGDALIREGAKRFLHDYGIQHFELTLAYGNSRFASLAPYLARQARHLFLYNGNGGFSGNYSTAAANCRTISRFTRNLVLLPSTFGFEPAGIRGTLFCRDRYESQRNCPRATFCHDMALYLYARGEDYGSEVAPTAREGFFFRTDPESSGRNLLRPDNVDLSEEGDHMTPVNRFMRHLARYETINTDRLHVGIGGLILGRKVNLFSSDYFKIGAICKSSLSHDPNLNFMGDAAFDGHAVAAQPA